MSDGIDTTRVPVVQITDGEAMADSRDVAAFFGKEHFHVLRTIRELQCPDDFRQSNFGAIKIKDLTGETTCHVMMTQKGFWFLVTAFPGEKAGKLKERYIEQFNVMETELRRTKQRPAGLELSRPLQTSFTCSPSTHCSPAVARR